MQFPVYREEDEELYALFRVKWLITAISCDALHNISLSE